mgnify:CR=1 FL=1
MPDFLTYSVVGKQNTFFNAINDLIDRSENVAFLLKESIFRGILKR